MYSCCHVDLQNENLIMKILTLLINFFKRFDWIQLAKRKFKVQFHNIIYIRTQCLYLKKRLNEWSFSNLKRAHSFKLEKIVHGPPIWAFFSHKKRHALLLQNAIGTYYLLNHPLGKFKKFHSVNWLDIRGRKKLFNYNYSSFGQGVFFFRKWMSYYTIIKTVKATIRQYGITTV